MEMITIKPHHFIDIMKLYGAGIEKFVPDEKMGHDFYKVANAIIENKNIPVKLTTLGDDICKPCSKYKEFCMDDVRNIPCFTSKNEYNSTLDKRIMSLYHLEKEWYTAYDLCAQLYASKELIYEFWIEEEDENTKKRFSLFEKGANKYLNKSHISE